MDKYIGMLLDGRYEILELIGTGGMANVYKSLCHKLNRFDAVKIMREDVAKNEQMRERFRAESKAIAMLSHPNIVSVYDVGYTDNVEYIVMELVDGITLKQYMEKTGPLKTGKVLDFSIQIAKALSHAHSRGIIHRDIKPQNVMLLKDGLIKVADFGIAALQSESTEQTEETIGSVHYIAPEQARGMAADARSDIYSLGIVMYEMLTGRLPYVGSSELEVAVKHMNTDAIPPRQIIPDIPEELERICLKAMSTEKEQRYQSAAELLAELEAFGRQSYKKLISAKPIESQSIASEESSSSKNNKRSKKHTISSGIIAVLVLIILLFLGIIGYISRDLFAEPEKIAVPQFVGRYCEDVINDSDYRESFEFTVKFVIDAEHNYGIILEQSPVEGVEVSPKSKEDKVPIELTVSAGQTDGTEDADGEVSVPDVINEDQKNAVYDMKSQGLEYIIVNAPSQSVAKGYVISTDPVAGETLKKGSAVEITVSSGPEAEIVPVPKLIGLSKDAAIGKLESVSLAIGDVSSVDSEYDKGTVIWQSIEAGTNVETKTKVSIQVSSGITDGE